MWITGDEAFSLGGISVTAAALAEARQQIAHEGTGYVPPWAELTPDEQQQSRVAAAAYLKALVLAMASRPHTAERGPGGTHLGDGVTAVDDGIQIMLWAQRPAGLQRIYLGPGEFSALVRFGRRLGFTVPAPEPDTDRQDDAAAADLQVFLDLEHSEDD